MAVGPMPGAAASESGALPTNTRAKGRPEVL
jgi:hypothetical protein